MIAVGDFNTYKDFELPLALLQQSQSVSNTICSKLASMFHRKYPISFKDAWTHVNPDEKGLTFSNMVRILYVCLYIETRSISAFSRIGLSSLYRYVSISAAYTRDGEQTRQNHDNTSFKTSLCILNRQWSNL